MSALGIQRTKYQLVSSRAALLLSSLDIPEILENVLRHLPNAQIRYGPICVCKAWHLVSLRVLGGTATWDHDMEPSNDTTDTIATTTARPTQFDQQLLTATRLKVHFKTDSADTSHISQALTTAIQNSPTCTQQRIRTLYHLDEVQGLFKHFHHDMFRPLQHLTTLHVITNRPYYHNLDELFLTFPNLEELVLGQNLDFTVDEQIKLTRSNWEAPYPTTTVKLRALTPQSAELYGSLEQLLSQCLRLKELGLVRIEYVASPVTECTPSTLMFNQLGDWSSCERQERFTGMKSPSCDHSHSSSQTDSSCRKVHAAGPLHGSSHNL